MNDPYDHDEPMETPSWRVTGLTALSFALVSAFITLLALRQGA